MPGAALPCGLSGPCRAPARRHGPRGQRRLVGVAVGPEDVRHGGRIGTGRWPAQRSDRVAQLLTRGSRIFRVRHDLQASPRQRWGWRRRRLTALEFRAVISGTSAGAFDLLSHASSIVHAGIQTPLPLPGAGRPAGRVSVAITASWNGPRVSRAVSGAGSEPALRTCGVRRNPQRWWAASR